jgi:hypothetical protein
MIMMSIEYLARRRLSAIRKGGFGVAKKQKPVSDLTMIAYLLQNLLAIELWRGGLTQAEIGTRLGVATGTVNSMLKGVSREVPTIVHDKE